MTSTSNSDDFNPILSKEPQPSMNPSPQPSPAPRTNAEKSDVRKAVREAAEKLWTTCPRVLPTKRMGDHGTGNVRPGNEPKR